MTPAEPLTPHRPWRAIGYVGDIFVYMYTNTGEISCRWDPNGVWTLRRCDPNDPPCDPLKQGLTQEQADATRLLVRLFGGDDGA